MADRKVAETRSCANRRSPARSGLPPLTERQIEKQIVDLLEVHGWSVLRTNKFLSGNAVVTQGALEQGIPDLQARKLWPGDDWKNADGNQIPAPMSVVWIEVKRPGKNPSEVQGRWIRDAVLRGEKVIVAHCVEDVAEIIGVMSITLHDVVVALQQPERETERLRWELCQHPIHVYLQGLPALVQGNPARTDLDLVKDLAAQLAIAQRLELAAQQDLGICRGKLDAAEAQVETLKAALAHAAGVVSILMEQREEALRTIGRLDERGCGQLDQPKLKEKP